MNALTVDLPAAPSRRGGLPASKGAMRAVRFGLAVIVVPLCATAAAAGCASQQPEDFNRFLARFMAERPFAVGRTLYPLDVVRHEVGLTADGQPEDTRVRRFVTRQEDAAQPSLRDHIVANALDHKVQRLQRRLAEVDVFKPDTDWLVSYHFRRQGACWFLRRVEDHSL
jgi:hypothetical protein